MELQKGNENDIPSEFPKIQGFDDNLVKTEFLLAWYPIEAINPESGMAERYFMYKESGKIEDVVYNPEFQTGLYGVIFNSGMTPTRGQSGAPYLINFHGDDMPTMIGIHVGVRHK